MCRAAVWWTKFIKNKNKKSLNFKVFKHESSQKCFSAKTKFASHPEQEPKAHWRWDSDCFRWLSLGTNVPISSNQQSLNHYSRWVQTFNALSCTWFPAEPFPAANGSKCTIKPARELTWTELHYVTHEALRP